MDVDVEVQLFGLSSYYAAVVMETLVSLTTTVVVMIIVVYGSSFSFSSAVADVATTEVVSNHFLNGDG